MSKSKGGTSIQEGASIQINTVHMQCPDFGKVLVSTACMFSLFRTDKFPRLHFPIFFYLKCSTIFPWFLLLVDFQGNLRLPISSIVYSTLTKLTILLDLFPNLEINELADCSRHVNFGMSHILLVILSLATTTVIGRLGLGR